MPRRTMDRLPELLVAGTRVFSRKGFRQAQMADVAAELGVSVGTLYNHVASKEALFLLCVQHHLPGGAELPLERPVPAPSWAELVAILEAGVNAMAELPELEAALRRRRIADARSELEAIVGGLYDAIVRTRRLARLLEASVQDLPELFDVYYLRQRRAVLARLAEYLALRIRQGYLRPLPDVAVAARLLVETCAWFGRHRHGDLDTADIDDATARSTVVDILTAGLVA